MQQNINMIIIVLKLMNNTVKPGDESAAINEDKCIITKNGITGMYKVKEFNYIWIVKDFQHYHHENGESIESPHFTVGDKDEYEWSLDLYPKGWDDSCQDYLSIQPYLYSTIMLDKVFITFYVANKENEEKCGQNLSLRRKTINEFPSGMITKFVERDFVFNRNNGLLPNGDLTVICRMCLDSHDTYSRENMDITKSTVQEIPSARRLTEFNDFEQLLENGKFSDVKLMIGEKEFCVHKNILGARSRVFSAMFEHDMKEQKDNTMIITDIEPEVMEELLRFIYVGKVNNIQKLACDLLGAANKYELQGLKTECEEVIITGLSVDNVGGIVYLVDKYDIYTSVLNQKCEAFNKYRKFQKSDVIVVSVFVGRCNKCNRFKTLITVISNFSPRFCTHTYLLYFIIRFKI